MSCSNTCQCDSCRPAFSPYRGTCEDVGSATSLTYLGGYTSQFCPARLEVSTGLLQSILDGSGNPAISFQDSPQVALPVTTAVASTGFGNIVIIGSDDKLTRLQGPATANLFLRTTATGQLIFAALPATTVPDPLIIGTINVTVAANLPNTVITGTVAMSGIVAGTPVLFLGLDGSNNVVSQTAALTFPAVTMFFESPTSPSAATPNSPATSGNNLIIGNQIYDSGGALITVTTSQQLTVAVAGKYLLEWCGMVEWTGGQQGRPSMNLLINGIVVNYGNGRPDGSITTTQRTANLSGIHAIPLAVGTTISIQLGSTSGTSISAYEVRLVATRLSAL